MIGTNDSASIGMTLPLRCLKNLANIFGLLAHWDSGRIKPKVWRQTFELSCNKGRKFQSNLPQMVGNCRVIV
jgi:hypothetical protein